MWPPGPLTPLLWAVEGVFPPGDDRQKRAKSFDFPPSWLKPSPICLVVCNYLYLNWLFVNVASRAFDSFVVSGRRGLLQSGFTQDRICFQTHNVYISIFYSLYLNWLFVNVASRAFDSSVVSGRRGLLQSRFKQDLIRFQPYKVNIFWSKPLTKKMFSLCGWQRPDSKFWAYLVGPP